MKTHKIFGFFLILCLIASVVMPASAEVVSPTSDFYVYDGADVLSDETESYIINTNRELESKTGAQIVVVTIPSLEGASLEEYAVELFRQWGIGNKEKNNGLLLLCALEEREFRVEVGYGLEGDLPDGKTGRMQDQYIIPKLRDNNFDEGIMNGYIAFLQEVSAIYGVSVSGEQPEVYEEEEDFEPEFATCLAIGCLISSLGSVFLLKKKQKKLVSVFWGLEALQLLVFSLVLKSFMEGIWVTGITMLCGVGLGTGKIGRNHRGSHWGGGFSGGGGGFGGFSGGGGRSGGGGSSRGF